MYPIIPSNIDYVWINILSWQYCLSSNREGQMAWWCCVNFQCQCVLLIWITVGQGPIALAVGAGRGCLDIFSPVYYFSPSLWYRLKYCLKGPLSPKQSTNQFLPSERATSNVLKNLLSEENDNIYSSQGKTDWMTCNLTSLLTVFQSYQDNRRVIMMLLYEMEPHLSAGL